MKTFAPIIGLAFLATFGACSVESRMNHFNETAAESEAKPERILKTLNISKGMSIADLGSGGGYYTFRFVDLVGETGRVLAVDINQGFLDKISLKAKNEKRKNINTILAQKKDAGIPASAADLIFIRNTFHHLPKTKGYFQKLGASLKANGRVAVIDYRKDGKSSLLGKLGHSADKQEIITTFRKAGFEVTQDYDFLPRQNFLVFRLTNIKETQK